MAVDCYANRPSDQTGQRNPMSDAAAEEALSFLVENAERAGVAKAHMIYMEHFRKTTLARLRREAPERTADGRDSWARAHPQYEEVLIAQVEANTIHEALYWRRIQAEATIEAWRSKGSQDKAAGKMR